MPEFSRTPVAACLFCLGLAFAMLAAAPASARGPGSKDMETRDLCASIIARAERRHGIPARLLRAISLAETGRYDARRTAMIAWPWAVNAGGKGRYYPSKSKAIAAVERLRARGARNIDVGCMQVNLMHHPKAFADLKTAFDPARNVAYAARFLKDLHARTGSWIDAVAAYHSSLARQGNPYMLRVLRIWVDRRARPNPAVLAAKAAKRPGAIAGRPKPSRTAAATAPARTASLVRRAGAQSPASVKKAWAKVVARRTRFAEWLARRQAQRQAQDRSGQPAGTGNPG